MLSILGNVTCMNIVTWAHTATHVLETHTLTEVIQVSNTFCLFFLLPFSHHSTISHHGQKKFQDNSQGQEEA